jgi:hypothetical protein
MFRTSAAVLLLWLAAAPEVAAQLCGRNSPAEPVPRCRHRFGGEEIGCGEPDAVRLWPAGLRPGRPGQTLPLDRDSTQWESTTPPGANSGHELFHSVDVVGTDLYVVYNSGLQVWKIDGPRAEFPTRVFSRDGWRGDFLDFPEPGKNDFYTLDVAAIAGGGSNLIAVAAVDTAGVSLWQHVLSPPSLGQLYQDLANDSRQVRLAERHGVTWALAAGVFGIGVYDVSRARELAAPCLDFAGTVCPGIYRGRLGNVAPATFVDVVERDDGLWIVATGGPGLPLEIWRLSDPAQPATAERMFLGLPGGGQGVAWFEKDGVPYLGVVQRIGISWQIRIYDVAHCLDAGGCGSLGAAVWSRAVPTVAVLRFLTYSVSNGRPFLYFGAEAFELGGSKTELLLDLERFPEEVAAVTDGAGTYFDPCSGHQVDYWGDYYPLNGRGLNNVRPRVARFRGKYLYRAAWGLLDVHVYTPPSPPPATSIFKDGFERGLSGWAGGF